MGWDVSVVMPPCVTCGRAEDYECDWEYTSYTHNCNGMMRKAMEAVGTLDVLGEDHLYALNGMSCSAAYELLGPAIGWWEANPGAMVELNPPNGWGDSVSAFRFWKTVADLCRDYPTGKLRLSG